jgi:hypothetical protein
MWIILVFSIFLTFSVSHLTATYLALDPTLTPVWNVLPQPWRMLAKSVASILTNANAVTNADQTPRYESFVNSILSKFYIVRPRVEQFEDRVLRLLRCSALGMPGRNQRKRIDVKLFDAWPAGAELSPDAQTLREGEVLSSTGYHLMSETVTPDECVRKTHEFLFRFVEELVEHGRVVEIPILVSCPCGHFTTSLIPTP